MFGAVHGVIGDKVLNTYLNDVVTVACLSMVEYLYCGLSDVNGDRC